MNAVLKEATSMPMPDDWLDMDALDAIDTSTLQSLDLAMLGPMKKQLEDMGQLGEDLPPEMFDIARKLENVIGSLVREQQRRLDHLCEEDKKGLDKAVKAKQPIEDRWIDDTRQFMSESRVLDSKLYPNDAADPNKNDVRKPITVAATRSRVLFFWARLCDMMLPANDLPFRVDAPDEPDPEDYPDAIGKWMQQQMQQAQAAQQQGQQAAPPPSAPDAAALQSIAEKAASDMQDRVFAMAKRANFKKHAVQMLWWDALLGCGILKGPFPEIERKRKRRRAAPGEPATTDFEVVETPRAGLSAVNPWFFWYDMATSLDRSSCTYEVQLLSRRELEDFKAYPRVMTDVVDELLADPDQYAKVDGELRNAINKRNNMLEVKESVDDVYPVLETNRIMDPKKFEEATGIKWEHPEPPVVALWSCHGRCIKWKITPLERDFRVPYYSTTIMRADDTIFGYGCAWMARGAQRITDGAMNATLVNAGASATPWFLVAKGLVQPNREKWSFGGNMNVFSVESGGEEPIKNFAEAMLVPSNVQQNLELLQVAQDMMDQDTLFNQIQQGNFNGEEMPASGVVMAANIGSVFQKSIASDADDNVFQPLCERLIWWDSMYAPEPLEGDFVSKGIASTQLVSKDLALQHTSAVIQLSQNPQFAGFYDAYELYSSMIHNIDGLPNRDAILFDKEKAMANQARIQQAQQQGDPAKAAQIASAERIAMAKLQSEERLTALKAQADLTIENIRKETAIIELMTAKDVDLAKISADVQKYSQDDATKRMTEILRAKVQVGQQEIAQQNKPSDPHSRWD